jgi:hypothetical protein
MSSRLILESKNTYDFFLSEFKKSNNCSIFSKNSLYWSAAFIPFIADGDLYTFDTTYCLHWPLELSVISKVIDSKILLTKDLKGGSISLHVSPFLM